MLNHPNQLFKRNRFWLLSLMMLLLLTSCQKTTQFSYDPKADPIQQVEQTMNDLKIDYNPPVERMVIVAAALKDGVGFLQEHHLYDFSNINLQTSPGGKIIISVPQDPSQKGSWKLVKNVNQTSSRPFLPEVFKSLPGVQYDRLNFLLEPTLDSDTTFVFEDEVGNRKMTFRVNISGLD